MGSHFASNMLAWTEGNLALWLDRSKAASGLSEQGIIAGSWRGSWVLVLMMRLS
jgi:hypothetical protein